MEVFRIEEVGADHIDSVNRMCTVPGSDPESVLWESREAHRQAAALGARVFAAFQGGEPVGRTEVMPSDAAPLPLEGEGLWVIRCLWVLPGAQRKGIARSLMDKVLLASAGSKGIAVVTYPDWMPVPFFERFGFTMQQCCPPATVLLRKNNSDAHVSYLPPERSVAPDGRVRVEAVMSGRCPWIMQYFRARLADALRFSEYVVTSERLISDRSDALRCGDENIYIDNEAPFAGPVSTGEFTGYLKERLRARGLPAPD
ncbi:MAG: GNAT family N-acetyltransferase [Bacillota bacterium]